MSFLVGADARCLNTDFVRGIGEYLSPLATAMRATGDISWSFYGHRPDLPFHMPAGPGPAATVLRDIKGYRFHTWEQAFLPWAARRDGVRVLHCTSNDLPLWQPVPTVVTIHDTIPWDTGESLNAGFYRDKLLPAALRRCKQVITISEHSRGDILRLWPDLEPKLRVIRHGLNERYLRGLPGPLPPSLRAQGIGDLPYLVYFGGTAPRKRLGWTLELFHALGRADIGLVVCGVPEAAHDGFRQTLPPETRPRVLFAPFLAADDMPALYRNALAVLYPTLYEGFGVPPLNAQAVGTPVVFSNVSSLKEMIGPTSAALEPDDRAAWLATCRDIVDRRLAGMDPDEASRVWAARFDWRNSAAAHWEVYREAAGVPA